MVPDINKVIQSSNFFLEAVSGLQCVKEKSKKIPAVLLSRRNTDWISRRPRQLGFIG